MKGARRNDFSPLRKNADKSLLIDIIGVLFREDVVGDDEIEKFLVSSINF